MSYIFDTVFAVFLGIAAAQDGRRREVEHWTIIGMVMIALARLFFFRDFTVLWALIPITIFIVIWFIKPDAWGAADVKMLGVMLLYTGLAIFPLLVISLACIFAAMHMRIFKMQSTPLCLWLGIAGCGIMAVRIFA